MPRIHVVLLMAGLSGLGLGMGMTSQPVWADETQAPPAKAPSGPAADSGTPKPPRASKAKPHASSAQAAQGSSARAATPAAPTPPATKPGKHKKPNRAADNGGQPVGSAAAAPPVAPTASAPKDPAAAPAAATKPQPAAAAGPSCSLEEREQPRGGRLDVVGSGFGQAPVVRIAQRPARMLERRSDRISVQVPADSDGGPVTLQADGHAMACGTLVIIGKNR